MSGMDYTKDLKVDMNSLETEWERQPSLYMRYALMEADAQEERDKAQRNVNIVKADMDAKIRGNPTQYGIEKISEAAILNVVIKTKEYRQAELAFIQANKESRVLSSAVTAFEHKKRALSKLTDLWIAGYYGGGGVPKESRDRAEEKIRNKQLEGLNRRKK